MYSSHSRIFSGLILLAATIFLVPLFVHAQTSSEDDLHVAIWSSLLSDPRTAHIPPSQMQALVDSLANEAQKQNLSPADILYRPERQQFAAASTVPLPENTCDSSMLPALCAFGTAFGFAGSDPSTPVALLATSTLLILIIKRMIKMHDEHAAKIAATAPPWS